MALIDIIIPSWLRGALSDLASALRDHTAALDRNTRVHGRETEALHDLRLATADLTEEVGDLAEATHRPPTVLPANRAEMVKLETEPADGAPSQEIPMSTQLRPGQNFKGTLRFNGKLDGEPTFNNLGPGTLTTDPSVYTRNEEQPDPNVEIGHTDVVCHYQNPVGGGTGECEFEYDAKADLSATPDVEERVTGVATGFVTYIPPDQAKATTATMIGIELED